VKILFECLFDLGAGLTNTYVSATRNRPSDIFWLFAKSVSQATVPLKMSFLLFNSCQSRMNILWTNATLNPSSSRTELRFRMQST